MSDLDWPNRIAVAVALFAIVFSIICVITLVITDRKKKK